MKAEMTTTQAPLSSEIVHSLVTKGDVSMLTSEQRAEYYIQLCERVGLDPATQPFLPLRLSGKEVFYASKGAAEQLRKLHKISVLIVARERLEDVYYVTARATTPDGRTDESQGAVSIGGLKGENLANAVMKAETKAKRRVTLSIVGLGMLDESELDTIRQDQFERLPAEKVSERPVATVVSMPQPKLETARAVVAAAEQPRRADAPADGLPQPTTWTPAQPIPVAIRMVVPQMAKLELPVAEMSLDELEAVVEACANTYERWKEDPKRTEKQLNLINRIGSAASAIHYSRTSGGAA